MDNRINVEQVIKDSKKKERFPYIFGFIFVSILLLGSWLFYFNKLEAINWRGFFTIVIVTFMILLFLFTAVKLISVHYNGKKYQAVLTKFASLVEKTQVPESALITSCKKTGDGRFGFDAINYSFWKEGNEFVFYPVRPTYKTARFYDLVQAVRLDVPMVRSFYVTGDKYFEIKPAVEKVTPSASEPNIKARAAKPPVFRDTRATVIAYAVGDQTVYLTFGLNLYDYLKELIPDKDKSKIEAVAKQALADSLLPITGKSHEELPIEGPSEDQDSSDIEKIDQD